MTGNDTGQGSDVTCKQGSGIRSDVGRSDVGDGVNKWHWLQWYQPVNKHDHLEWLQLLWQLATHNYFKWPNLAAPPVCRLGME